MFPTPRQGLYIHEKTFVEICCLSNYGIEPLVVGRRQVSSVWSAAGPYPEPDESIPNYISLTAWTLLLCVM
jgi:hypothetical protein